jgi:vitamin B12 transporter
MNLRTTLLSLAWLGGTLIPAAAQDPAPKQEQAEPKPKDVIITASRVDEAPKDVASSNTVITGADLKKGQQRMVVDALREVPSLDTTTNGGAGSLTNIFIRGANSGQTLVLIDGVEANNPISTDRGFDFANLTTDNIERIEVIRGPQSVLYGSDAMGGVINVITKRGQGDPHANFMLEAGSFGTYRGSIGASGGSKLVNYSVSASRSQTAGISAAAHDLGNHERDGYRNETLSARVELTPEEYFDLDFTARGMSGHTEIDNFGGVGGDDPNHVFDTDQWLFQVAPRLRLFNNLWEQTLAFSITNLKSHDDNPADAVTFGSYSFSTFNSELVTLDWQNSFFFSKEHTFVVGLTFREESGDTSSLFSNAFPPPADFISVMDNVSAWIRSAYGEYRIHLFDRLTASAGARVDDHKEFGTHGTYRGTVAYILEESDTKLRATVGSGFKAPSLFELFSSFGDPNLKPEESLGWDVGVDQGIGSALTVSVTYFKNNFSNLIDFDGGLNKYVNVGRARTEGVEAALRLQVTKELEVRLSYTHLDTEDKSTGQQLLRRAPHKGGVRVLYSPVETVHLNASVLYVGNRHDLDFATFPATPVTLDDYILVSLAASWRMSDHFEGFIRGENVANQKYEEVRGYGVPGAAVYAGGSVDF